MSEDIQHLLVQVPLAGMVLWVVRMFLAYLKERNTKMETALEKVAKSQEKMAHAQTKTAGQLGKAETVLVRVFDMVRK